MRTLSIVLTATLILATAAPAQEAPADWIRKLGSGSYAERERAAKALEKTGKAALPLLRDAIANADLETRRRAVQLMERIEDRILLDNIVTATPTRLYFQDMNLNDALRAMEARVGLRAANVASKHRIERIDTGELPFWQAWAKFCKDAEISESDYAHAAAKLMSADRLKEQMKFLKLDDSEFVLNAKYRSPRIEFAPRSDSDRYSVDDRHSVRVRVRWLMADHHIDKAVAHAVFAFEVRAEPRLEIVGTPRIELTKMIDAMGTERPIQAARVVPASASPRETSILSAFAGEVQYGGLLHLKAIPWQNISGKLRSLHGNVRFDCMARPSLLEIAQVSKSVGKTVRGMDGITLKLLECDTTEEGDLALRLHLHNLASLTPLTTEQRFIRVRPGVLAERSAIDVAMERFELRDGRGQSYRRLKARYQPVDSGKSYEVELHFAAKSGQDEPTLVLTKAPRAIACSVPFVVQDVIWGEANRRP